MLTQFKNIYFIGIGGIGMSALARHFNVNGYAVGGYDKTSSSLTGLLEAEGMKIHFEDNIDAIPADFKAKENTLIVFTPAVPKAHKELNYFIDNGFTIKKRSEVLAELTLGRTTIAVAGTHGKTSTAAFISHLLRVANVPFYAFLGVISVNYHTNYLAPIGGEAKLVIVEADEYDRSFLKLFPDVAIITAVEPDHLDIYGTFEKLQEAYSDFASQVQEHGKLILNTEVKLVKAPTANIKTYSAHGQADYHAENIHVKNNAYYFDAILEDTVIENLEIGIPGRHNIENSIAAMGSILSFVKDPNEFREGLRSFKGVWRRFEVIIQTPEVVYIDDYAHHPTEIEVTINTVKELYPDKKITGIFQPHLFSRTKDLADDFARVLSTLDELIIMPIYPARELPMEGVTSRLILDKCTCVNKRIESREEILEGIKVHKPEVLLTIGAGDIDRLVPLIKEILTN
jgi:UDP-N-acetylmuramate--alanine ligase